MMVTVLRTIPFWGLLLLAVAACRTDGATTPPGAPDVGANASLSGRRPFPDDNPWNTAVDGAPVDPSSDALIASIGLTKGLHPDFGANYLGGPFGIPYVVVAGGHPAPQRAFSHLGRRRPWAPPH